MRWNDFPYWLRSGIITILILIVIQLILFFSGILIIVALIIGNVLSYLLLPVTMFTGIEPLNYFWLISSLIFQFVVGSIIGLIIGKIKSKR